MQPESYVASVVQVIFLGGEVAREYWDEQGVISRAMSLKWSKGSSLNKGFWLNKRSQTKNNRVSGEYRVSYETGGPQLVRGTWMNNERELLLKKRSSAEPGVACE